MAPKPTIVLVPGSFSSSTFYTALADPLRASGHTVHLLDPPSYFVKKAGAPPTVYDDAAYISGELTALADAGAEIVLLAHSYGGTPSSQALKGVTARERAAAGKQGGVVRVGYITAVVPHVGGTVMEFTKSESGEDPPIEADADGWLVQTRPDMMAKFVFNCLPEAEGAAHVARFGQHSGAAFVTPLTHAGYADVAVSWFFCTLDYCITPTMQERAIQTIEESWKAAGREGKVDVTRVECDHVPVYSANEELVKWVEGLVEKGGRE